MTKTTIPHELSGICHRMASALDQAILRMEDTERQHEEAAMKQMWLPQCKAALADAKLAVEQWRNYAKA